MVVDPPTAPALDLATELEHRVAAIWWRLTREMPSDLSRTAASVLGSLRGEGPQRVTALAAREYIAQPSMSVLLQRLERRGLVRRRDDPEDKRACLIEITAAGEQALQARADARSRFLRERLERLEPAERDALTAALGALDRLLGDEAGA